MTFAELKGVIEIASRGGVLPDIHDCLEAVVSADGILMIKTLPYKDRPKFQAGCLLQPIYQDSLLEYAEHDEVMKAVVTAVEAAIRKSKRS